jgi:exodeoxyribonuclease (lambda-induced)
MEQNTAQWYGARLFHFTSSELSKLLTKPKSGEGVSKTAEAYIYDKIAEELTNGTCLDYTQVDTKETRWGHELEPVAREAYEKAMDVEVELCGFIEHSPSFGGSPDGLVGEDGGIEIKCPYNSATHARYLLMQSPADLKALKPEYYAQIQGNLLVTGRKWFDFVSYDPRVQNPAFALKVLRVERDEKMIAEIEAAIARATDYLDELLKQLMTI